ncbi:hypothetical protein [Isoptericola croceus]|uniref:hypothetical protein n=1 Tax=Isoptericola croceus TaxID=3031406 RepID=UPI0023F7AD5C|nr:hypothetical protein [Isoptericola croceus]
MAESAPVYDRSSDHRYDPSHGARKFAGEPTLDGSPVERAARLPAMIESHDWADRVRAAAILESLRSDLTLPDGFPVIVEVSSSPNLVRWPRPEYVPARHVWVAHPDVEVLRGLLDDYQAMWDGYTAQWGPNARRLFTVAGVDGVSAGGLYRPEASPDDVLRQTAQVHGMQRWLPQRLR